MTDPHVHFRDWNQSAKETVYHGMIELGQKLDDPYTVENMQKALYSVYSTKADRVDITETDLYVRFLPKDNEQFQQLQALGLYLMDHPMDYQILKEGDYYQDPEVGSETITWQYAVVPHDFTFPEDIRYELIDKIFISEHVPVTRADEWVDWELVEKEAFRPPPRPMTPRPPAGLPSKTRCSAAESPSAWPA